MTRPETDMERVSRQSYSLAFALNDWRLVSDVHAPDGYSVGYQAGVLWIYTSELSRSTGIPDHVLSAEVARIFDSRPVWDTGIQFGREFKEWVATKMAWND